MSRWSVFLLEALKKRLVAIVRTWYWPFVLAPWATLALFLTYVVRARLVLGHWPQPYNPDPKELGFVLHRWAVLVAWVWQLAASLFVVLSLLVLPRLRKEHLSPTRLYLTFAVGSGVAWVANGRLVEWWAWFFD